MLRCVDVVVIVCVGVLSGDVMCVNDEDDDDDDVFLCVLED